MSGYPVVFERFTPAQRRRAEALLLAHALFAWTPTITVGQGLSIAQWVVKGTTEIGGTP